MAKLPDHTPQPATWSLLAGQHMISCAMRSKAKTSSVGCLGVARAEQNACRGCLTVCCRVSRQAPTVRGKIVVVCLSGASAFVWLREPCIYYRAREHLS